MILSDKVNIYSELVGLDLLISTLLPNNSSIKSKSPLVHDISIACLIHLSTFSLLVLNLEEIKSYTISGQETDNIQKISLTQGFYYIEIDILLNI